MVFICPLLDDEQNFLNIPVAASDIAVDPFPLSVEYAVVHGLGHTPDGIEAALVDALGANKVIW